jgi:hypothetical protein
LNKLLSLENSLKSSQQTEPEKSQKPRIKNAKTQPKNENQTNQTEKNSDAR